MITTVDDRVLDSFAVGEFGGAGECLAFFRDVRIPHDHSAFLVKMGQLPPARMTLKQVISAESPDAYAGIYFLVAGCATRCQTSVRTAVEIGGSSDGTVGRPSAAHS